MLLPLYELPFVNPVRLFQCSITIKFVGLESTEVFKLLLPSCPGQSSIGLIALVILALVGVIGSLFFPFAVKFIIFELSLVLKLLRFVFSLLSVGKVIFKLALIIRAIGKDIGAFAMSFTHFEFPNVEGLVFFVEFTESVRKLFCLG